MSPSVNWFTSFTPPVISITFAIFCQQAAKNGSKCCVWAGPASHIAPLRTSQTVLSEHTPSQPVKPWPRTPCFPSYPSFFPGAPERGRELQRPHYADCSSAWARYIPESWARSLAVLPLSLRSFLSMSFPRLVFLQFSTHLYVVILLSWFVFVHVKYSSWLIKNCHPSLRTDWSKFLWSEWWRWWSKCLSLV